MWDDVGWIDEFFFLRTCHGQSKGFVGYYAHPENPYDGYDIACFWWHDHPTMWQAYATFEYFGRWHTCVGRKHRSFLSWAKAPCKGV